jgi:glycerophosphoryl diester phosphodiesterase
LPDISKSLIKNYGIEFKLMSELDKQRSFAQEANVWTVNDPSNMKIVFQSRYQFLTTNFPDYCIQAKNEFNNFLNLTKP